MRLFFKQSTFSDSIEYIYLREVHGLEILKNSILFMMVLLQNTNLK